MKSISTVSALVLVSSALLSACSAPSQSYNNDAYNNGSYSSTSAQAMNYGVIDSIQFTRGAKSSSGTGAVVGGVVGALVGNQFGSGDGRTAATVVGAVGGAVIGNNVESNRNQNSQDMYQISVRLNNGGFRTVVQDSVVDLRVGNRVQVVDGRVYRY